MYELPPNPVCQNSDTKLLPYLELTDIRLHCTKLGGARQVMGSIPDGVIVIFQWHNPSSRIMALGSTQPLTEMSTRCISWG